MKINSFFIAPAWVLLLGVTACGNSTKRNVEVVESQEATVAVPSFEADSAYNYIEAQANFGPRVPNSAAHQACGEYLATQLESFGAKVYNQYADLIAYDGTLLKARNIIGAYNPDSKKRIMLCAHWDSRPYADYDADPKNHHTPILGINDGASGVGVLLEIARLLQQQAPTLGVDIIFFDAEDYGTPEFYRGAYKPDTWCLGSQYWGRTPHVAGYNARYGILLDMVGAKGSTFYYEGYSARTANSPMKRIWKKAKELGHDSYFIAQQGGEVIDDHIYVHKLTGIPCVDIINYEPNNPHSSFGSTWHTVHDTMEVIDRATLQAVGETVTAVIYNEK
ncbi:MAG: M20 family metallopeptidase [Phocaeicola sp.]